MVPSKSRNAVPALVVVALLIVTVPAAVALAVHSVRDRGQRAHDSYSELSYELGDALATAPGVRRRYPPNVQGPCTESDPDSWVEFPYMVDPDAEVRFQDYAVSRIRELLPEFSVTRAPNSTREPVKAVGRWRGHPAAVSMYRPPRTTAKGVKYRVVAVFDPKVCGFTY